MLLPSARTLKLTSARLMSARLLCGALIATGLVGVVSRSPSVAFAQTAEAAAPEIKNALTFKQLMDLGYAASAQGDFHTALINFRRALVLQPNQPYAIAAADNMAYYIEHARISTRQREISQLESRLANATAQKDWVCAATTIDQLTMYTQPGSLNRERLIGQRGDVSVMLDARLNFDAWSTVCSAQRPVY